VLEIGTGSGYLTALLARRAGEVVSVEINPRLLAEGRAHLAAAGVRNARLQPGDGARGWGAETYDAIVLTGSTPMLPDSWLKQLKPNGRLFAVVGDSPAMTARLTRWTAPGAIVHEDLFETVIAPLKNAPQPARFVF